MYDYEGKTAGGGRVRDLTQVFADWTQDDGKNTMISALEDMINIPSYPMPSPLILQLGGFESSLMVLRG